MLNFQFIVDRSNWQKAFKSKATRTFTEGHKKEVDGAALINIDWPFDESLPFSMGHLLG